VYARRAEGGVEIQHVETPGEEWDRFAVSRPGVQLAHAAAWSQVLGDAYGLTPHYLAARGGDGAIEGILPLFRFRTLRGRLELVSLPFHDGAGVLARHEEAARALLEGALEAARDLGAGALELRQVGSCPGVPEPGSGVARVNLVLPLEASEEAQWKALGAKVRNQTRKAGKEGLAIADWPLETLLDGFYRPFAVNMRDLGSPAHARGFFGAAARHFGDRMRFVVAADGTRPVGGLVAIEFAGRTTVTWASTLRSERARCPNNLIYWEAMRWALARGCREFDFGRSPIGEGTYRFKRGWGAEERPLAWVRLSPDGRPLPLASPGDDPVLARLSRWWTRLPVGFATFVGSRIRRRLAS